MFARTVLVLFCLLLAGRANASTDENLPSPSQLCRQSTTLVRSVWLQNLYVAPPEVSVLMVAVIDGKVPQVRQKLKAMQPADAARWRQTALITAAFAGQSAMVDALLHDGAEVDGKGWLPRYKPELSDSVVAAMKRDPRFGGPKAVEGLKASGLMDNKGEQLGPALVAATSCDDAATVNVLLRNHANPGMRLGPRGADVLLVAILNGNAAIVRALLDHGVDVCADDRLSQHRWLENIKNHPGFATKPHLTYAALGRRQKLPAKLVSRLACSAFDTASTH